MQRIERAAPRAAVAAALAGVLAGCAIAPSSAPPSVRDLTPPPSGSVEPAAGRDGSSPRAAASRLERSQASGAGTADGEARAAAAVASLRPGGRAPAPRAVPAPGEGRRKAGSAAVAALLDDARAAEEAGRYGRAAASLERALKVAPRDPRLWHRLAVVRYRQGRLAAAESLALRSVSLASAAPGLDARSWRVVVAVRQARGDRAGAEDALRRANLR